MTPEQRVEQIMHEIRMILMGSDTDYGEEILVTKLVKDLAIWHVTELLKECGASKYRGFKKSIENFKIKIMKPQLTYEILPKPYCNFKCKKCDKYCKYK